MYGLYIEMDSLLEDRSRRARQENLSMKAKLGSNLITMKKSLKLMRMMSKKQILHPLTELKTWHNSGIKRKTFVNGNQLFHF